MGKGIKAEFLNDLANLFEKYDASINDEGYNYLEFWCGEECLGRVPADVCIDTLTIRKLIKEECPK